MILMKLNEVLPKSGANATYWSGKSFDIALKNKVGCWQMMQV